MRNWYINPFAVFFILSAFCVGLGFIPISDMGYNFISGINVVVLLMAFIFAISSITLGRKFFKTTVGRAPDAARRKNVLWLCACTLLFFIVEVLYNNGVPILLIFSGEQYDYTQFGLPTLHVFFVAYLSAFAVINFARFCFYNERKYLLPLGVALSLFAMMMNRGAFLIIALSCSLLWLHYKGVGRPVRLLAVILAIVVGFGVLGDKRLLASGYSNENAVYEIGRAKTEYVELGLPTGFFWLYMYASSPFGNLGNQEAYGNVSRGSLADLVSFTILPDFVQKRVYGENYRDYFPSILDYPELNVSTGFAKAYIIAGYSGIIVLYAWMLVFVYGSMLLIGVNYRVAAGAIFSAFMGMMVFDNMLVFASGFLQPIILAVVPRLSFKNMRLI